MYLGLDIGGTHTDAVIINNKSILAEAKVVTNHENLTYSVTQALQELFSLSQISPSSITRATFGSTLAINTIVQDKQDVVGLILGAGPGINPDWFTIGDYTFITSAQLDHRGTELLPLNEKTLEVCIQKWQENNIHHFACVSKFSVRNPKHENEMEATIQRAFRKSATPIISKGHHLSDSFNFPRRVATTYWNTAIWRIHNQFVDAIELTCKNFGITAPTFFLKADGGSVPLEASRTIPIEAIHSGPAASIMGILALYPTDGDCFLLDIGGTTTDIAIVIKNQPLLASSGLVIQQRPTLIRSLLSHSIPLGGDSLITITMHHNTPQVNVGPLREGPAMAFGGNKPTFLDCLNILNYTQTGNYKASYFGLYSLAKTYGLLAEDIAQSAIIFAQQKIYAAMSDLLDEANNNPIHTIEALLEDYNITPKSCIVTGGPSSGMALLLEKFLNIPVKILPQHTLITNAIGAALTRPTATLKLYADTEKNLCTIPSLELQYTISKDYSLQQASIDAFTFLKDYIARTTATSKPLSIDIIEAKEFSMLNTFGRKGKDIRIYCQVRPTLEYTLY